MWVVLKGRGKGKGKDKSKDYFMQHGEDPREFVSKVFINDCICC